MNKTQMNLWVRISNDLDWMKEKLGKVVETEFYVKKLVEIADKVKTSEISKDKLRLDMTRNDFMIEEETDDFYQVEFNMF